MFCKVAPKSGEISNFLFRNFGTEIFKKNLGFLDAKNFHNIFVTIVPKISGKFLDSVS